MCGREGRGFVSIAVSGNETGGAAVLSWLKHGLSNKEIGLALSISPRTAQKHLQRVFQQLEVQTRAKAIVRIHRQARCSRA